MGLAGCFAICGAPRDRTKGKSTSMVSPFYIPYEWRRMRSFSVLELIMTAPMVVDQLDQLYSTTVSTVDNRNYGSVQYKTTEHWPFGVEVLERYSGDPCGRVAITVDATMVAFQHEPLPPQALSIEAPIKAMNDYSGETVQSVEGLMR